MKHTPYCTHIQVTERIRVDLFSPSMFRVRVSDLKAEAFPAQYEIPFAIGHLSPWGEVFYTAEKVGTNLVIRTDAIVLYCNRTDGRFIVERADNGARLYPSAEPQYGMFLNHCIVFDSANFHKNPTKCSRYCHWFYNFESGLYDISLPEDALFDTYFIYNENYRDAYAQFNTLVGAEPMLCRKGFGFYQTQHLSKDGTQALLLETAKQFREREIPCDTFILDFEWGDGANDGQEILPWGQRLDWSSGYTSPLSPAEMVKVLQEKGFDLMLIHHSIPDYPHHADEGWICKKWESGLWYQKLQEKLDIGIVGTWQDTRKTDITNARIYTTLQQKMGNRRCSFLGNYELFENCSWTKDTNPIPDLQKIGGRRTPFAWTGDMSYTLWDELKFQIRAIANEHGSLKGISYLTNDCMRIGGRKLSVCSCQFLCFNSVTRAHNAKPWQGNVDLEQFAQSIAIDDDAKGDAVSTSEAELLGLTHPDLYQEELIRKFLTLRYRLIPYIYTTARQTYDCGLPILRPLMIAYQNDPACNQNQWPLQYLFGDNLLVCPVYTPDDQMTVYLPAGNDWIDFFYGTRYAGGQTLTISTTDLSYLPLFVRAGAILPMADASCQIEARQDKSPLTLQIYEGKEGSFELYEDDGTTLDYQSGAYTKLNIEAKEDAETLTVRIAPIVGAYPDMPTVRRVTARFPWLCKRASICADAICASEACEIAVQDGAHLEISFDLTLAKGAQITIAKQ